MSREDEVKQLRAMVELYRSEAEEAKSELEEHVVCSRQMEAEYDEQFRGMMHDLSMRQKEVAKLTAERDKLRESLAITRKESVSSGSLLKEQLQRVSVEGERLAKLVQHLEQENDNLERELRITQGTLIDTEEKLNAEIESHAILTTELETNDELKEQCQRLEDEIRDLRVDNTVKSSKLKKRLSLDKKPPLSLRSEKHKELGKIGIARLSSTDSDKQSYDSSRLNGLSAGLVETGMASKLNTLSSPLARNVSPIITDLLATIQGTLEALEAKLRRLTPDRRSTYDNGLVAPLTRY